MQPSTVGADPPPQSRPPAWMIYLLVGSVVIGCYFGVARGHASALRLAKVLIYCAVSLSAAVALLVGQRRQLSLRRAPLLPLAAAQTVYFSADATSC